MCSNNPYRGIPQENIAQNDLRGGLEWVIGVMIEKLLNRDQHRALNGNHLKYVFTEEVPDTDINEEKLDETVEGKLHSIPKRLDAFIEDLALLYTLRHDPLKISCRTTRCLYEQEPLARGHADA